MENCLRAPVGLGVIAVAILLLALAADPLRAEVSGGELNVRQRLLKALIEETDRSALLEVAIERWNLSDSEMGEALRWHLAGDPGSAQAVGREILADGFADARDPFAAAIVGWEDTETTPTPRQLWREDARLRILHDQRNVYLAKGILTKPLPYAILTPEQRADLLRGLSSKADGEWKAEARKRISGLLLLLPQGSRDRAISAEDWRYMCQLLAVYLSGEPDTSLADQIWSHRDCPVFRNRNQARLSLLEAMSYADRHEFAEFFIMRAEELRAGLPGLDLELAMSGIALFRNHPVVSAYATEKLVGGEIGSLFGYLDVLSILVSDHSSSQSGSELGVVRARLQRAADTLSDHLGRSSSIAR